MIEDVTVSDLSIGAFNIEEERTLKYTCNECNVVTTSKKLIDEHVKNA